jgi:hypothetical protein
MPVTEPLARGLWGVLATPFTADAARVDEESLRREVAYLLGRIHDATGTGPVVQDYPVISTNLSGITDTHVTQIRGSL